MKIIARIYNDFKDKFGIPRQSGITEGLESVIVFEPEYRNPDAIRGIEEYSHLWLIWNFSKAERSEWSPTVRPPRLGGNKRVGVFATRSPFRPNPIGLSSVKLLRVEHSNKHGNVLIVGGADIMNGTPIYDIKPYLSFADSHPEAVCGFADVVKDYALEVDFPKMLLDMIPQEKHGGLIELLSNDPRPQYKADGEHEYGLTFSDFEIKFIVADGTLKVTDVQKLTQND